VQILCQPSSKHQSSGGLALCVTVLRWPATNMARRSPQGGKGSRGAGRGRSPSPARPNWEAQAALDPCEPAAAKPASLPAARAMDFGRHGGRPLISVSCRSAPSPLPTSVRCQPRERSVRAGESSTPAGSGSFLFAGGAPRRFRTLGGEANERSTREVEKENQGRETTRDLCRVELTDWLVVGAQPKSHIGVDG